MHKIPAAALALALVMAIALSSCGKGSQDASNSDSQELRRELKELRIRLNRLHRAKTGMTHVDVRFESAPHWFAESRQSLFASMVVFPNEAKAELWADGRYERSNAQGDDGSAVHPDKRLHKTTLKPFLKGLDKCGDAENPVRLQAVGFASTSGLTSGKTPTEVKEKLDEERRRRRSSAACSCCESSKENDSDLFNLVVSNLRAKHTATMVKEFAKQLGAEGSIEEGSIEIEPHQWCRHSEMVAQRQVQDGGPNNYDTYRGMLNRRVEVRVLALPKCTNLDPAKRIPLPGA